MEVFGTKELEIKLFPSPILFLLLKLRVYPFERTLETLP